MARLRDDALPLFVTLTLPDGIPTDGESTKVYFRRFRERVRRRFPASAFIWRREVKARKSGIQVGAPVAHFHLLWYGVKLHPGLREWVSRSWYESVRSGDLKHFRAGTQVEAAKSGRQVKAYASKLYAAKGDPDDPIIEGGGRWWGIHNGDDLPWADAVMYPLEVGAYWSLLRTMRKYVRAKDRMRGRRRRRVSGWRFCFVDGSTRWADVIPKL